VTSAGESARADQATVPGVPPDNFTIALLGAECTGKTTLANALWQALAAQGHDVVAVSEYLREFCALHGRTPTIDEQHHVAAEQSRRVAAAASRHAIVIADTTALMTAVYSDLAFGDASLYPGGLAEHGRCQLTLLACPDLRWQADGHQRSGPQTREAVEALLRAALQRGGVAFLPVAGIGPARLFGALASVQRAMARR